MNSKLFKKAILFSALCSFPAITTAHDSNEAEAKRYQAAHSLAQVEDAKQLEQKADEASIRASLKTDLGETTQPEPSSFQGGHSLATVKSNSDSKKRGEK